MWQYFYAHAAYHGVRWFPQGNRCKMSLFVIVMAAALIIPQVYIIRKERSSRYCSQPLLPLAIASIVFSFFMLGFTLLFCILIPVHRAIKIAFHVFGVVCLGEGLWLMYGTFVSFDECSVTMPELYFMSQISAILSGASIAFLVVVFPFWIVNEVKKNLVLDPYSRTGVCYEPARCCTCIWHV